MPTLADLLREAANRLSKLTSISNAEVLVFAAERLEKLEGLVESLVAGRSDCTWTIDLETCSYDTACGEIFQFIAGGPLENGFEFCPYCGGKLGVVSHG